MEQQGLSPTEGENVGSHHHLESKQTVPTRAVAMHGRYDSAVKLLRSWFTETQPHAHRSCVPKNFNCDTVCESGRKKGEKMKLSLG